MPYCHVGVLPQVLVSAIKEGREGYVMRRFELEPYLRYHAKYQVTELFSVPPMLISIVMSGLADPQSKNYKKEFSLKSVRNGTVGYVLTFDQWNFWGIWLITFSLVKRHFLSTNE